MNKKIYFYIVSIIFLIVALVHFLKIFVGFEISIFGSPYPLWLSWTEVLIGIYLAIIGFRLGNKE